MFARVVTFTLKPGHTADTRTLADQQAPIVCGLPGFRSLTFLYDDASGRYGSFSTWATREDAEAVSGVAELQMPDELKQRMTTRPVVGIYEVYSAHVAPDGS